MRNSFFLVLRLSNLVGDSTQIPTSVHQMKSCLCRLERNFDNTFFFRFYHGWQENINKVGVISLSSHVLRCNQEKADRSENEGGTGGDGDATSWGSNAARYWTTATGAVRASNYKDGSPWERSAQDISTKMSKDSSTAKILYRLKVLRSFRRGDS